MDMTRMRVFAVVCLAGCAAPEQGGGAVNHDGSVVLSDAGARDMKIVDASIQMDMAQSDAAAPGDFAMPAHDASVAVDGAQPPMNLYRFPATSVFYRDVSHAPLDGESGAVIGTLQQSGKWTMQLDPSFAILRADSSVQRRAFTPTSDQIDCDTAPVPLPPGGHIEGVDGYECSGSDCHLIVFQGTRLYEMYQANVEGGDPATGAFTGDCLVVWDLTRDYWASAVIGPGYARGDGCNGADAADLPIAPMVLTAAELRAGVVTHALRFSVANALIRAGVYVHPATHIGGPTGGAGSIPYGGRLRLRADYDVSQLPNDAARAVARALQRYGMIMTDGGSTGFVSATQDVTDVISTRDLRSLQASDFELVDGGQRIIYDAQDCSRTPITD